MQCQFCFGNLLGMVREEGTGALRMPRQPPGTGFSEEKRIWLPVCEPIAYIGRILIIESGEARFDAWPRSSARICRCDRAASPAQSRRNHPSASCRLPIRELPLLCPTGSFLKHRVVRLLGVHGAPAALSSAASAPRSLPRCLPAACGRSASNLSSASDHRCPLILLLSEIAVYRILCTPPRSWYWDFGG